ncbi:sporulation integral membrane protein YtvI [Mobilisporobacter senegalensis]|uniref:sporulation integral membrane protein YtvI n=1 Tax=Mobilisporobacter senegalensis TaxID=1329262 RepID=UPI000F48C087|nr:sporulation integral membrane protein YtvI [Mobilisporobacter senegalensis]
MKTYENDLQNNQSKDGKGINKKKYILTLLGTTLGVYLLMKCVMPLVVPFLFAYLIAAALLPLTRIFERKLKIPKTITGGTLLILLLLFLGCSLFILLKNLINQIVTLLTNLPVYQASIMNIVDSICVRCDGMFGLIDGQTRGFFDDNINTVFATIQRNILPSISQHTLFIVIKIIGLTGSIIFLIAATLLMIHDADAIKKSYSKLLIYEDIRAIKQKIFSAGVAYFRAQLIIMSIVAAINVGGLLVLKNRYALLIGIVIAIIDAFPVLGSGIILIPWAIISLFSKDIFDAAILMSIYFLCQLVRQILEPRLIGDKIGIHPIFTIMAIYVGIQLFGIMGFILGPLSLVTIRAIIEVINGS